MVFVWSVCSLFIHYGVLHGCFYRILNNCHSWGRENTQNIKELVWASRGKGEETIPYCFSQQTGGGVYAYVYVCMSMCVSGGEKRELIGCVEISNTLQNLVPYRSQTIVNGAAGFTAVLGNTHSTKQAFHRQWEGQQSLPGVPERVETTTPRSDVSWGQKKCTLEFSGFSTWATRAKHWLSYI